MTRTTYAVVRWRAKRPRITIYCRRCSARLIIYREHGKTVEVCGCGKAMVTPLRQEVLAL